MNDWIERNTHLFGLLLCVCFLAFFYLPIVVLVVNSFNASRFGGEYPALTSTEDGVDRFLVACTCVGVANEGGRLRLHATYGLDELEAGVLRPNPKMRAPELFRAKAESYRARWPSLRVEG